MGNDGRRHGSYKPLDLSFPLTPLPAGDDCLAEFMKSRFMKLDSQHIRFVPDCMRENTTKIRNIKQYLKAAFSMPCPLSAAAALPLPPMTWQAAHLRRRSRTTPVHSNRSKACNHPQPQKEDFIMAQKMTGALVFYERTTVTTFALS